MFTGLVAGTGTIRSLRDGRLEVETPARRRAAAGRLDRRQRRLPHRPRPDRRGLRGRRDAGDAAPLVARAAGRRRRGQPRAAAARRATASAATSSRATSTAPAPSRRCARRASRAWCGSPRPPSCCATSSRRARSRVDGVSLTVSAVDDEAFEVSLIPETLERTTLGSAAPGRHREPGGRRARQVRGEAEPCALGRAECFGKAADEPVQPDRGGARGRPRRQDGRRLRRRGPRERGRPHAGGPVRHARGDQLHGHARARADLPRARRPTAATSSAST